MTPLSQKNTSRIWGYEKIKRCIPKEDMPHASAYQKKERIKDAYPKKVCHMLRHVKKKKKKGSLLSKKKEKER